jgi:hypothetical protein
MSLLEFMESPGIKWLCFLLLFVIALSVAVMAWIELKYGRGSRMRRARKEGRRFMRRYEAYRAGIGKE